jgi:hypothetical protein
LELANQKRKHAAKTVIAAKPRQARGDHRAFRAIAALRILQAKNANASNGIRGRRCKTSVGLWGHSNTTSAAVDPKSRIAIVRLCVSLRQNARKSMNYLQLQSITTPVFAPSWCLIEKKKSEPQTVFPKNASDKTNPRSY